ncbi:MAG: sulfotransferase family 2 domain-containing protein [Bdellovibrionales bacterium]|nr:sulfotransferase family 2 domain-containing protein [Bdellovibrionales bacterium]
MKSNPKDALEDKILLYAHVGRSGGHSVNIVLSEYYNPLECIHFNESNQAWKTLRDFGESDFRKLRCVRGHGVYYGIHEYLSAPCTYFSIVRDPVERLISQYHVHTTDPTSPMYEKVKGADMSLLEYQSVYANQQALQLLGIPQSFHGEVTQAHQRHARTLLDRDYIGLGCYELYLESVFLLEKALGWDFWVYPSISRSSGPDKFRGITEEDRRVIGKSNQFDKFIHQYAGARVRAELLKLSAEQKEELLFFQESAHLYQYLTEVLDPGSAVSKRALMGLLQKRELDILVATDLPSGLEMLGSVKNLITAQVPREINFQLLWDSSSGVSISEQILRVPAQQVKECDFVFVIPFPGKAPISLNQLQRLGVNRDKIIFAFNPPPI